jgi:hypothetical protein
MMLHSVIIGIIVCVFMIFVLGQQNEVAKRRSILITSVVLHLLTFQMPNKKEVSLIFIFSFLLFVFSFWLV